jgi:hypothetical protein
VVTGEVALTKWSVRMATAFLIQATFARTAIVHSVCKVSVSGTLVPNNLVAPVQTEFLVKLECPASTIRSTLSTKPSATSMPDKTALYMAISAGLANVILMGFVLPASVNLAPTSPVRRPVTAVHPWQLEVQAVVATKRVYLLQDKHAMLITNALLATATWSPLHRSHLNHNALMLARALHLRWSG